MYALGYNILPEKHTKVFLTEMKIKILFYSNLVAMAHFKFTNKERKYTSCLKIIAYPIKCLSLFRSKI